MNDTNTEHANPYAQQATATYANDLFGLAARFVKQFAEMLVFARVVQASGLSAAAQGLGLTTSAVSRSVARLETHFGGQLLNRSARPLSLTELGSTVYAACALIDKTLGEVEAFAQRYARAPAGWLRVSAPVAYGQAFLAPRLKAFMAQCPDVAVELELSDRIVDLMGESFDLAIRIAASIPPSLVARSLGSTASVLVASPDYLAQAPALREPGDLLQHPVVCLPAAAGELKFRRGAAECGVVMRSPLTINNSAAIVSAVSHHIGIGLVPDYSAHSALGAGHLVQLLPGWQFEGPNSMLPVRVVYPPTRHLPRKVRAFIDFLVMHSDAL